MWQRLALAASRVTALTTPAAVQDVTSVIERASNAMGLAGLDAITYSGQAAMGNFGQSRTISFGLTGTSIRNYTRTIDFTRPASHVTGTAVPRPIDGGPAPPPGPFDERITPSDRSWAEQLQMWVTPWGFLKGAAATNATLQSRKVGDVRYDVVTWSPAMKAPSGQPYRVVGYINPASMVDRVETWVEHPVLGDLHVETTYRDYRAAGSLRVPALISQKQIGMETFVAAIGEARANPPDLAELMGPDTPRREASPAPPAASERLADGVYRITGGYVALAVEFRDHVVVLEGGQSEARGLVIMAETRRVIPHKPIKFVVNTHPHFDHAAGLPPFAAEGATILTDDNSRYFVEQALRSPRTLLGDALARSRRKPRVDGVIDTMVLRDETRIVELHHVQKLEHSDAMLLAYLPKERILFTADFNEPGPGQPVSPSIATLVQNIERLQLDFDRHVMVHPPDPDRPMSKADLLALIKR